MQRNGRIIAVAAATLGLSFLVSCSMPLFGGGAQKDLVTGRLTIAAGSNARTVFPAMPAVDHYVVTLMQAGQATISESHTGGSFAITAPIPIGTWGIVVDAYSDATTKFGSNATAGQTVTISPGPNSVSVAILPLTSGNGNMSVIFDLSAITVAQADSYSATLKTFPGNVAQTAPTPAGAIGSTLTLSSTGLAAGSYLLTLQLTKGAANQAPINELVQVYANLTSTATIVVGAADLSTAPGAPTGVQVKLTDPALNVIVSWVPAVPNTASGYTVYKNGSPQTSVPAGATSSPAFGPVAAADTIIVSANNSYGNSSSASTSIVLANGMLVEYSNPRAGLNSVTLGIGDTLASLITPHYDYSTATAGTAATPESITWTSSNPSAASVDSNGVVTALARGATTITVQTAATLIQRNFMVLVEGKADMTFFALEGTGLDAPGLISGTGTANGTITVYVPTGTSLTGLKAYFQTAPGAAVTVGGVAQTSGATSNDFTNPVTYTVTGSDSSTQTYVVRAVSAAITSQTFSAMGAAQTYSVPANVHTVYVDALGSQGGSNSSSLGGYGGRTFGPISVTPGETLNVYAGSGNVAAAFNGGAATGSTARYGGGASDVRQGGTALTNRVIVAGGGGGAGSDTLGQTYGGPGGGLVAPGIDSANNWSIGGGYPWGNAGFAGIPGGHDAGGASVMGGYGAVVSGAGGLGLGGAGAHNPNYNNDGGGGGGGYYGGSGGAPGIQGGGGAGGSSFVPPGGSTASGYQAGDGKVVISYLQPRIIVTSHPNGSSGYVYVSADSGSTWTPTQPVTTTDWGHVTASADGLTVYASGGEYGVTGLLYKSMDGGITWSVLSAPAHSWAGIACSSNGQIVAASIYEGSNTIWYSTDGGTTWNPASIPNAGLGYWSNIVCSADGLHWMILNGGDSSNYVSLWFGSFDGMGTWTWTQKDAGYYSYGMSSDGSKYSAVAAGNPPLSGTTLSSNDSGASWNVGLTTVPAGYTWTNGGFLAMSGDGSLLVLASKQQAWYSNDQGVTWTAFPTNFATSGMSPTATFYGAFTSNDGNVIALTTNDTGNVGTIWLSTNRGASFTQLTNPNWYVLGASSVVIRQ